MRVLTDLVVMHVGIESLEEWMAGLAEENVGVRGSRNMRLAPIRIVDENRGGILLR